MNIVRLPATIALLFWATTSHGYDAFCGPLAPTDRCAVHEQTEFTSLLVSDESQRTHFHSLDDAIEHYRQLAQTAYWPQLKGRFLIKVGQSHKQVTQIRNRLRALGDYRFSHPLSSEAFYDMRLKDAVMAFQKRHGLKVDGIVGPATRAALNITPRERWQQLMINRQRAEDDPAAEGRDYVEINIPDFRLKYFRDNEVLTEMRVIVGRKDRQTPVMQSRLKALEINPDWNVPKRIAYKDILPKVGDQARFNKLGVKLVKGWHHTQNVVPIEELDMARFYRGDLAEQYRFWQPPGESNPLGQLKFIFPNQFSVYMHGTPGKRLFDEPQRTFSSGCIRIEDPRQLAEILLSLNDGTKPVIDLNEELENRAAHISSIPAEIEIFTRYRTAWVDHHSGELQFRKDVYRRDPGEIALLGVNQPVAADDRVH